ncbi:hypothetical protein MNBD_GAMMA18-1511 [hydrothermal vent metagenome]|uniref:Uncharacterized protein n=1 Tax=hydrothermal vent metagenome TaxID=652676 RepID=A0A3B0YZL0_9ZZZZ
MTNSQQKQKLFLSGVKILGFFAVIGLVLVQI